MEEEIKKLNDNFLVIQDVICKNVKIKALIKRKLARLKEIHGEIIKDNNTKKIFLICLESFHFQYKVMTVETDNLHRNYLLFMNRTYCDYYNLYNLLLKQFEEYKIEVPTKTQHPVYKDLEPFFEYSLEKIELVRGNCIELIMVLISRFRENEIYIKKYKSKSKSGIRISNFINTLEYDNNVLSDQIMLYINYCYFFQNTQQKYFNKLTVKTVFLKEDIDNDITFHETPWDNTQINDDETLTQYSDECAVKQWDDVGISKEEMENTENKLIGQKDPENPETKDPELKNPELKNPELKNPELKNPELKDSETKDSDTSDSEPNDTETKDTETKDTETKDIEPKETEPKETELKETELKNIEPKSKAKKKKK
jgi:hypothetical protein